MTTKHDEAEKLAREIAKTITDHSDWFCTNCNEVAYHCLCENNVRDRAKRSIAHILTDALREQRAAGRRDGLEEAAQRVERRADTAREFAIRALMEDEDGKA